MDVFSTWKERNLRTRRLSTIIVSIERYRGVSGNEVCMLVSWAIDEGNETSELLEASWNAETEAEHGLSGMKVIAELLYCSWEGDKNVVKKDGERLDQITSDANWDTHALRETKLYIVTYMKNSIKKTKKLTGKTVDDIKRNAGSVVECQKRRRRRRIGMPILV